MASETSIAKDILRRFVMFFPQDGLLCVVTMERWHTHAASLIMVRAEGSRRAWIVSRVGVYALVPWQFCDKLPERTVK